MKSSNEDEHLLCFDLTTPRQYTQHGNWNCRCSCGVPFGDDPDEVDRDYAAHLEAVNDATEHE